MDSILMTIKDALPLNVEYDNFDKSIMMHINTAIASANQIGIGVNDFIVTNENQTWNDFIGDRKDVESVKSYIFLNVKLSFDPPTTGYLITAMKEQLLELTCRLDMTNS